MRKTILLALALVAFVAMPAMASVQNVKVSGSIDSTWLVRNDFDLGASIIGDEKQNLFLTQTMVMVDADLTDNVSTTVCLINERTWSQKDAAASPNDSDVDLHLAYVTLREMLYSPLTVVVGRQAFQYGNSFIVDAAGTNNSAPTDSGLNSVAEDLTKQTAQDAIRLIFDYKPLSIEVLVSKVDSRSNDMENEDDDDVDLYGANVGYELGDSFNTQVEAYFFAKIDKLNQELDDNSKSDTVYVPGLRVSTSPIEGLNVQGEVAWQRGNRVASTAAAIAGGVANNERREAMGAQVIANYKVPVVEEYKPVVQYVYTYVSGDSNPDDRAAVTERSRNVHTAWDPMYENQSGGTIYNTLFNLSNAHINEVSLQANPIEDVTTKVSWTNLVLDRKLHSDAVFALLTPGGGGTAVAWNADEDDIGNEVDAIVTYDYTEDVQFGANFGWFMPGDLFTGANDQVATQAILHGNVNF